MKIRWKLLILLLVMTVLPIAAVRAIDALTMYRYGKRIAASSRENLLQSAELELKSLLANYTESLEREGSLLQLILEAQAYEVERRFAEPAPEAHAPVFYAEQFDGVEPPAPPELLPSAMHTRPLPDGTREPMAISHATQVVRVHPQLERRAVADDVARLADMTDVYRQLREGFPEGILWQYTSLESGVHFSYPGKGGISEKYEPRIRPWYVASKTLGEFNWSRPFRDVSTGEVVLSLSQPIRDPQQRFIGVTGIDVPVRMIMGRPTISAEWAAATKRIMLVIAKADELDELGLATDGAAPGVVAPVVFAHSDQAEADGDWQKPIELSLLGADDAAVLSQVVDDMRHQRTNVREVSVGGRKVVWAYGPLGKDRSVVALIEVPYAEITGRAKALERATMDEMWASFRRSALAVSVIVVLVVVVALGASRGISRPVVQLATAARDIADGNLDARVELEVCHRGDELREMADAFNAMVPKLRDQMNMRQSLELAMEVQQALLPAGAPKLAGFDIAGNSVYCDETGGDYYDFIDFEQLGPNRLLVIIGDVVGHGVAAALLMATVRALVRSRAAVPGTLATAMEDVNQQLCLSQFTGRFMTAFCLVVDKAENELRWVSAGHDPAFVYDAETDTFSELAGEDIPIGLQADWRYNQFQRAGFKVGEVIVMGTDGIWECRNAANEMFGKERLKDLIRQHAAEPAADIAHAIQRAVHTYRGDRDQQDDITLVVVKVVEGAG